MQQAFICDAVRTPIGRYGGALAAVRADDLAAIPLAALLKRNAGLDPAAVEEVVLGCANQAGEDNRNVARMATLLAGLPVSVPGATVNRLCGSGLDALAGVARAIRTGEVQLVMAGGVESMSRAPFVMPKADSAFSRHAEVHDTTIGWRFVNPRLKERYGTDSMPETGENVAAQYRRHARRPGPLCAAQPAAHRRRLRARLLRSGAGAGGDPAAQGQDAQRDARRAPAAGDHARAAGGAADAVPRRRHGHRRQRLGRQ